MRAIFAAALGTVLLPGLALAQSGISEPHPGAAPNAPAVTTPGVGDTTASTPGTASVPGMDMTPGFTTPDSTVVPPAADLGPNPEAAEADPAPTAPSPLNRGWPDQRPVDRGPADREETDIN